MSRHNYGGCGCGGAGGCGCGGAGGSTYHHHGLSPPSLPPTSLPVLSGESSMPSGNAGDTTYRRHSGGSGSPWMQTRGQDDDIVDAISEPYLLCACKSPLYQKRSNSARNPNRDYFSCSRIGTNAPYSCKTWIWVDLVRDYVEQMITFRLGNLQILEEKLAALQKELELKSEALMCREIEMAEQGSAHQFETTLMDAAARVQADMKLKRSTMMITSCPLLSMMIYLDNIDLGMLSKPHIVFPRILDFDSETQINKMIMEDMFPKQTGQGDPSWGASMARCREQSCYMSSEGGQPSSSHVQRPGKEIEKPSPVDGIKVGSPFSASILRPATASDFSGFLRQEYPSMFDSDIADQLKSHNLNCSTM